MIRLTRSDDVEILLNSDLIKNIEGDEESVITLTNGEKITVKHTPVDISNLVTAWQTGRHLSEIEISEKENET